MSIRLPIRVTTRSPNETRALGAAVASLAEPGDVVLLVGELGAGKTTFTKGLVGALDPDVEVTSPTFTLCHRYATKPPVAHVDCFRLDDRDDLADLALDELIDEGCIVVVEWGERARALVGDALACSFTQGTEDESRSIEIDVVGDAWRPRAEALVLAARAAGVATESADARP